MAMEPNPAWLSAWLTGKASEPEALARFDSLPGAVPERLTGVWRGVGLATGHPLDDLLEILGWYGKSVEDPDRVHPLLFRRPSGRVVPINPALMPTGVALRWPALARSRASRSAFAALGQLLHAPRHAARIRLRSFRGKSGAALIYHDQPIIDHLRRVDGDKLIGLMERSGMERPYFFLLRRDAQGASPGAAESEQRG